MTTNNSQSCALLVCLLLLFVWSNASGQEGDVEALVKNSQNASPTVLVKLFQALPRGTKSKPAIEILLKHLSDQRCGLETPIPDDASVGIFARNTLVRIGKPALIPICKYAAKDKPDSYGRLNAVDAIGMIGVKSETAERVLIGFLDSKDIDLVISSIAALESVHLNKEIVAKKLIKLFDHNSSVIRGSAIRVAGSLKASNELLEESLLSKLNDEGLVHSRWGRSLPVKSHAIGALLELQKKSPKVLHHLKQHFKDPNRFVRIQAAIAHAAISKNMRKIGLDVVGDVVRTGNKSEIVFALELLESLDFDVGEFRSTIVTLSKHDDNKIRTQAKRILNKHEPIN